MIAVPIEMPKCCDECRIAHGLFTCFLTGSDFDLHKTDKERLPDCPLIDLTQYEDDLK